MKFFSAQHSSKTTLSSVLFKYEIKLKIGWENQCAVFKCTQMRAHVEKVDFLGWNKSSGVALVIKKQVYA